MSLDVCVRQGREQKTSDIPEHRQWAEITTGEVLEHIRPSEIAYDSDRQGLRFATRTVGTPVLGLRGGTYGLVFVWARRTVYKRAQTQHYAPA